MALTVSIALLPHAQGRNKEKESLPWSVGVAVHWGPRKNREVYRAEFERVLQGALLEKECFRAIVPPPQAEVVLDVQLNDLTTEQEYASSQAMIPGQGEHHDLLSARASVKLDYSLRTPPPSDGEIHGGDFFRQFVRQPQSTDDPVEERALTELTADAVQWIVKDVCGHRVKLAEKIAKALGTPKPAP